jgi:hypothetical protein
MIGWRVLIIPMQVAICSTLISGCGSNNGGGGGAQLRYRCHSPTIDVDVASVAPVDVYICDGHANKVIWNGNANVDSFVITFDTWFSGQKNLIINSKTTGCGHNIPVCGDSPEVPAQQGFTVEKYSIVITPKSGPKQTLDPHVVSGGGLVSD